MKSQLKLVLALGAALVSASPTLAQTSSPTPSPTLASMSGVEWLQHIERLRGVQGNTTGPLWIPVQVASVDNQRQQLTISHGEIKSIGMPAMTMTFALADPAHLRMLKPGDTVDIQAANQGGVVRITDVRMRH